MEIDSLEYRMLHYVTRLGLIQKDDRTLIAVSGGVDSVVLCHLMYKNGFDFGIAHCNFQLRGNDSFQDETFVEQLAVNFNVPFYSVRFDTVQEAKKSGESIQVTARNLRYEWLLRIAFRENFQRLATAHHLDDSVETVLYNFTKGCGIRGLHGILPQNSKVIRPLLFAPKQEIIRYAEIHKIRFREDASNESDKYTRNLIRHHVIPVLHQINPSFLSTAKETIERLNEAESLFDFAISQIRQQVCSTKEGNLMIDIKKLKQYPALPTILFELIHEFGFNKDQISQIAESLNAQPGKVFHTNTWRLITSRRHLIISTAFTENQLFVLNDATSAPINLPDGILSIKLTDEIPNPIPALQHAAWMDAEKIKFPLTLRHWTEGDTFQPLGMNGKHQKLQDFFTNQKISVPAKEKIWLLESEGNICWIVGHRLDERYKITKATKKSLVAVFEPVTFV
jgi:tRNA(Ile)-lysidine synthase